MSALQSIEYMDFMMSAREGTTLSSGRLSQTALTAYLLPQLLMRKYSACMAAFLQNFLV
jgi:hypothetical protein